MGEVVSFLHGELIGTVPGGSDLGLYSSNRQLEEFRGILTHLMIALNSSNAFVPNIWQILYFQNTTFLYSTEKNRLWNSLGETRKRIGCDQKKKRQIR